MVGFSATQVTPEHSGSIVLHLFPSPAVGAALLDQALASLRSHGVRTVQFGAGGMTYFWPGVPSGMSSLLALLGNHGWETTERTFDLVQDVRGYATPPGVLAQTVAAQVTIRLAQLRDSDQVLAFEREHFPQWLRFYAQKLRAGDVQDILLAEAFDGQLIGTVLLDSAASHVKGGYWLWRKLLGDDAGAFGVIGVPPDQRRHGVGLALAAGATEVLRDRGASLVWVGYTWLVAWYGRLGYTVWRDYRLCRKAD